MVANFDHFFEFEGSDSTEIAQKSYKIILLVLQPDLGILGAPHSPRWSLAPDWVLKFQHLDLDFKSSFSDISYIFGTKLV